MHFLLFVSLIVASMLALTIAEPLDVASATQYASADKNIMGHNNKVNTGIDVSQVQAALVGKIAALTGGSEDKLGILSKTLGK